MQEGILQLCASVGLVRYEKRAGSVSEVERASVKMLILAVFRGSRAADFAKQRGWDPSGTAGPLGDGLARAAVSG